MSSHLINFQHFASAVAFPLRVGVRHGGGFLIMSNETKAGMTPGPWRVDETGSIYGSGDIHTYGQLYTALPGDGTISSRSFSSKVCDIHGSVGLPGPMANAKAIAALTELVEALRQVIRDTTCVCIDDGSLASTCKCHHCAASDALEKAGLL